MKRICATIIAALALSSCGPATQSGPVDVAVIGQPQSLFQQGVRLSPAAQHFRAATFEGLVALDADGQVLPAIAERWIVADEGRSYIFRLRNSQWPDGTPITGEDIRQMTLELLNRLEGTSLGLDFAKVTDVRAMTGRVVEFRLSSPMPEFLRLLAQPEMGFVKSGGGTGPMSYDREDDASLVRLAALPPEMRGLPALEDEDEFGRPLTLRALPADEAIERFVDGEIDVLLNGRLSDFPQAQLGPLSRGAVQLDPALGIFGLVVRTENGVLAQAAQREALSMALDRSALIQSFNVGGWQPTTWVIPPVMFNTLDYPTTRWDALTMEERRDLARGRIAQWEAQSGADAVVRIGLPAGRGSDLLFDQLSASWAEIGVQSIRVAPGKGADLELRDRLARYSSPRWYLNQFNCGLEIGLCSPEADALVRQSLTIRDPVAKEQALADAHRALVEREAFIPLGAPVRWSLVRGVGNAYRPNPWGLHPLFPLSQPTT